LSSRKSSVGGEEIRAAGAQYYNPDEAAREVKKSNPQWTQSQANGVAWQNGKLLLERAIREKKDFAFETNGQGSWLQQR